MELFNPKTFSSKIKRIDGRDITQDELFDLFKNYYLSLNENDGKFAQSWFDSTVENHFSKAHKLALEEYREGMSEFMSDGFKFCYLLASQHRKSKRRCFELYDESNQLYRNHKLYYLYRNKLDEEVELIYKSVYEFQNSLNNKLIYMLKKVFFFPLFIFSYLAFRVNEYRDELRYEVKSFVSSKFNWCFDTVSYVRSLTRFVLFCLIFYAILLLLFAINTFHAKDFFLLVFIFVLIYKLFLKRQEEPEFD